MKDDIEFAAELNDKLSDLQNFLSISPAQVHLLIDFRSFDEGETDRFSEITIKAINQLVKYFKI